MPGFQRSPFNLRPAPLRRTSGGFALLITLTLLAFVVLLLVGLAAYTRIETAISGNTQKQAQARQNALLALDVAVSQLQKNAGPDRIVTATADGFSGVAGTRHYTGVWDNTNVSASPVWLVSGSETGAINVTVAPAVAQRAELVGAKTSGVANDVVARLMPVTTVGVPGVTGPATIGNYAWWIGDQGVKAPVGLGDNTASVNYPPWTESGATDLRDRIRQQISLGAGAADSATGAPVFEPRDTANAPLAKNLTTTNQLAFLKTSSGAAVGLATLRQNYHAWSPNNFNVLASTAPASAGLRRDLSLDPMLLGTAFAVWADYKSYMEDPASPVAPAPLQAYGTDPIRRRYFMQPSTSAYGIAPVLSFFGLSFSFRNNSSNSGLEVASRCVVGLWNPYTAALVPENLELVITGGLPEVLVVDSVGLPRTVRLQPLLGAGLGLKFLLPFTANNTDADRSSWLPGRVYNWSASSAAGQTGAIGNAMEFYVRDSTPASGGSGVIWPVGPPLSANTSALPASRQCFIGLPTTLTIELRRASDGAKIAEFNSAKFDAILLGTNPIATDAKSFDFAFIFRLPDRSELPSGATATWLQAPGRDPREASFPASGYIVPGGNGNLAEQFGGPSKSQFTSSYPDQLLDRATNSYSYNEDVPVFEFPRAPLLSLGTLQHLAISGSPPFAVGNPWGVDTKLNSIRSGEIFDQFFFSGLVNGVNPSGAGAALTLPNTLLRVIPRTAAGNSVSVADDIKSSVWTSRFLLSGGAFNLNCVNEDAWGAVLRGVRFPGSSTFNYLDASFLTGTSGDISTQPGATDSAQFFRFSQSAQEVFKSDKPVLGVTHAASTTPPTVGTDIIPNPPSSANTHLFRQGMKVLSPALVTALSQKIVQFTKRKFQASASEGGPFRTMDEFLSPNPLFADGNGTPRSLLEAAIADAATAGGESVNGFVTEFSSQFLTQGDIMTALAPVLFPRSDTFVIRTYGEAVNPATGLSEGKAWCEATVQRVPDYFDPAADTADTAPAALTSTLNQTYGRRFKVVSFRWLTRSDI